MPPDPTTPTLPSTEAPRGATLYPELAAKEASQPGPAPASADTQAAPDPASSNAAPVTGNEPAPSPAAEAPTEPAASKEEEGEGTSPPSPLTLDSYADLKVPEAIKADETAITEFKSLALDAGVAPEKAEAFLNLYAKNLEAGIKTVLEAQQAEFTKTNESWLTESLALPEFQGEREATTKAFLSQMMEEFGSADAAQILAATGAGNHPAVVKYLLSLGQALIEGEPTPAPGVVVPANGRQRPATLGQGLYPNAKN